MSPVRTYSDELEGYAYLPRMFDKARARLAGDTSAPPFGCPLDHSCLARLHVSPEEVLDLVRLHGDDDNAMFESVHARKRCVPPTVRSQGSLQRLNSRDAS